MAANTTNADTILAVDFGSTTTRALLFDVVENAYRFVGYAEAPTTVEAPYHEASEGLRHALADLEAVTGREFLDDSARLLMPATTDGRGVDTFVATSSAGPAVRALLVGLLPDVSLESARRVAAGSYVQIVDRFSLGDTRGEDQQIDAVIAARPELILIAGGTDGGASEALVKLVETISLACHLLPPGTKSRALFAGNAEMQGRIGELLGRVAQVRGSANVLPALDHEQLGPARAELGRLYEELRVEQLGGFYDLAQAAGGRIVPTAQAEGHYVRFLSKLPAWPRGVLSVNAGSANTSVAAAWNGRLHLSVRPGLGVGLGAANALAEAPPDQLTRWLPYAMDDDSVRAFLLNKSAYPQTVPADSEDLWLELALARYVIRTAVRRARPDWPENVPGPRPELLPWFSLIIGGGAVLGRAPRPGLAALVLLDALQPAGVTRLMADPYHLAAALGATAYANPLVTAQVQDSHPLLDLGTAVSLIGRGRLGEPACHVKLVEDSGATRELDVAYGALEVLPLAVGRSAKLTIRPRTGFAVGTGLGGGRSVRLTGGALGVVVDARGRPIGLPRAAEQRHELVRQWSLKLNSA
jgi:uncharacterized protein (TIGR01319 family)